MPARDGIHDVAKTRTGAGANRWSNPNPQQTKVFLLLFFQKK
jgi:hypothetical protein